METILFLVSLGLLIFISIRVNDIYNLQTKKEIFEDVVKPDFSKTEEPSDDEDYMSAKDFVISTGKASTSALQTAFRWGYNKAARIINELEHFKVVGPAEQGKRFREILIKK